MNDKSHHLATVLNDDPDWAAFLYVTDELSVEEARLFEDQLADREDLQLALIETTRQLVCLSNSDAMEAQQFTPSQFTPSPVSVADVVAGAEASWGLKAGAIAAGLVACLAIAVFSSPNLDVIEPAVTNATVTTSGSREQTPLSDTDGIEADTEVLLAWLKIPTEEVVDEDTDVEIASDLSVPDWMLTAVLLEAEDFDEAEDSSLRSLPPIKNTDSI